MELKLVVDSEVVFVELEGAALMGEMGDLEALVEDFAEFLVATFEVVGFVALMVVELVEV